MKNPAKSNFDIVP